MTTSTARHAAPPPRTPRRPLARSVGDTLLTLLAVGGVVCIVLVLLSVLFRVSLIMFKTGSMDPTIPTGSVAVVREIRAEEIRIGDVVTVDRPGDLPVTHRVTTIGETEGSPGARTITMKGDANASADPLPYTVHTVRLVLDSVPGLASVIVWFSHPLVLGGVTLAASGLVMWAFWPRRDDVDGAPARANRSAYGLVVPLIVAAGSGIALSPAEPAAATTAERVVRSQHLTLRAVGDESRMGHMLPGDPVSWDVQISADTPEPSTVWIGYSQETEAAEHFLAEVRSCAVPWSPTECAVGEETLRPAQHVATIDRSVETSMSSHESRWIRVTLTLAETPVEPIDDVEVRVHAWVGGDAAVIGESPGGPDIADGPDGSGGGGALAVTGRDVVPAALLAAGAVGAGVLTARIAAVRRQREREREGTS
jgi:signal peptidase